MKKTIFVLGLVTILVVTGIQAFANAAAPYRRPGDQMLVFDDATGIALIEEWITYEISETYVGRGTVEVVYLLKNQTRDDENITLLFLAPYLEKEAINISLDGEEIRDFTLEKAESIPENWEASLTQANIDPVGNRELTYDYDHWKAYQGWSKQGFQFDIQIPKGQEATLRMRYATEGGYYAYQDVVNHVYTQLYYLTPASFWEGQAIINMTVKFPSDQFELYSNMPMSKVEPGVYAGTLTGIPDEEWFFNYVHTKGLFFGTNHQKTHNLIVGALMVFTLMIGYVVRKKKSRKLGWLVSLLAIPQIALFRPTYGTLFFLMIFGPFIIGLVVIAGIIRYLVKRKERNARL
jgi:hypothetical protein